MQHTHRDPAPLPALTGMAMTANARDRVDVEACVQAALTVLYESILTGRAVDLPGIGVIEVVERPSRRVRANCQPGAPEYETGPRLQVRLRPRERLQRELSEQYRQSLTEGDGREQTEVVSHE